MHSGRRTGIMLWRSLFTKLFVGVKSENPRIDLYVINISSVELTEEIRPWHNEHNFVKFQDQANNIKFWRRFIFPGDIIFPKDNFSARVIVFIQITVKCSSRTHIEYHSPTEFPETLQSRSITLTIHYGAILVLLINICFLLSTLYFSYSIYKSIHYQLFLPSEVPSRNS